MCGTALSLAQLFRLFSCFIRVIVKAAKRRRTKHLANILTQYSRESMACAFDDNFYLRALVPIASANSKQDRLCVGPITIHCSPPRTHTRNTHPRFKMNMGDIGNWLVVSSIRITANRLRLQQIARYPIV